jgi:hypothetical protein
MQGQIIYILPPWPAKSWTVVPLADNMFYATLNRNKNTPFLKKGNDSKLCTHSF